MSDPTYRIEREHTPGSGFGWYVRIFELADDFMPVHAFHSDDAEQAIVRAQEWIAAQHIKQPTLVLYAGDDGRPVEGHSVKAPS